MTVAAKKCDVMTVRSCGSCLKSFLFFFIKVLKIVSPRCRVREQRIGALSLSLSSRGNNSFFRAQHWKLFWSFSIPVATDIVNNNPRSLPPLLLICGIITILAALAKSFFLRYIWMAFNVFQLSSFLLLRRPLLSLSNKGRRVTFKESPDCFSFLLSFILVSLPRSLWPCLVFPSLWVCLLSWSVFFFFFFGGLDLLGVP